MRVLIWGVCIAAAFSGAAVVDEGHHHEELTQEQLGTVHFPVSCTSDAQKTFEKGVALLHSFWYEEAEKTFLDVEKQDPKSAIIKRASAELKRADKAKAKTDRERDYIQALKAFYSNSKKADHEARAR